jgi:hypothetical protein
MIAFVSPLPLRLTVLLLDLTQLMITGHHGAVGAMVWCDPSIGLSLCAASPEPDLCYSDEYQHKQQTYQIPRLNYHKGLGDTYIHDNVLTQ